MSTTFRNVAPVKDKNALASDRLDYDEAPELDLESDRVKKVFRNRAEDIEQNQEKANARTRERETDFDDDKKVKEMLQGKLESQRRKIISENISEMIRRKEEQNVGYG